MKDNYMPKISLFHGDEDFFLDEELKKLKKGLIKGKLTGAMGIEAIVALRRIGIEPNYVYGVSQVAVEAARSGLPLFIVCIGSELPALLQRLNDENIKYTRIDVRKKR